MKLRPARATSSQLFLRGNLPRRILGPGLILAFLSANAAPAEASGGKVAILDQGSCPSAREVERALAPLLDGWTLRVAPVEEAPRPEEHRVSLDPSATGGSIRLLVDQELLQEIESAGDCQSRAQTAAVVIALRLDPPPLPKSPEEPAEATREKPPAPEPEAKDKPFRLEIRAGAGASLGLESGRQVSPGLLAGGRISWARFGLDVSALLLSRTRAEADSPLSGSPELDLSYQNLRGALVASFPLTRGLEWSPLLGLDLLLLEASSAAFSDGERRPSPSLGIHAGASLGWVISAPLKLQLELGISGFPAPTRLTLTERSSGAVSEIGEGFQVLPSMALGLAFAL